jgi:chromosomal replication initiation ATPase DnaA
MSDTHQTFRDKVNALQDEAIQAITEHVKQQGGWLIPDMQLSIGYLGAYDTFVNYIQKLYINQDGQLIICYSTYQDNVTILEGLAINFTPDVIFNLMYQLNLQDE